MKNLIWLLFTVFSLAACTKSNEPGSPVFEAFIDGVQWKATTATAILVPDLSGAQGNFNITGYTNDGKVIYIRTKENTVSNLDFREQLVNLISFTATTNVMEGKISLTWQTATESHADKFQVERSVDGMNFSKLADIKAKGNSDTVNTYTYTDRPPFSDPFNNGTYYRLKMIDLDASFHYSHVIKVHFGSPAIYKYSDNNSNYAYGYSGSINLTEVNTQRRTINGTFSFSYLNGNTGQPGKIERGVFKNVPY